LLGRRSKRLRPGWYQRPISPRTGYAPKGLDYLLRAARAVRSRRLVAQSYSGWPNERSGGPVKTEQDPLDQDPPKTMAKSLAAIRRLEKTVSRADDIEGVVPRYGGLYGEYGTPFAEGGEYVKLIRKRRGRSSTNSHRTYTRRCRLAGARECHRPSPLIDWQSAGSGLECG
jgi:hypothetical protein